jgi:hypothetical protein
MTILSLQKDTATSEKTEENHTPKWCGRHSDGIEQNLENKNPAKPVKISLRGISKCCE